MSYWKDRYIKTQEKLTTKNIKEAEKQLVKYYRDSMERVISDFEATLDKLIATMENDRDITPADLYKLNRYWEMQGQLKMELQKLGDKQVELLSKRFIEQYLEIYQAMALQGESFFNSIDTAAAQQAINQIWCADGESWKSRIWKNTDKLQQALNDGLVECVVAGASSNDLRKKLMKEFDVAFVRADTLVRTEMAHIQTQAARKRYEDYGIKRVQVWASKDERRCEICGELHEKPFFIYEEMPVPAHPNCRCCIVPMVED